MPSPPPPPAPLDPPRARFVMLVAARDPQTLDWIARRFESEMGFAADPLPLDLPLDDGRPARWLALAPLADPSRLPGLQNHALRVAALYRASDGAPAAEIQAGYVDARRVASAALADGPARLYLGEGIWGEIVAETDGSALSFRAAAPADWTSPAARDFLAAVAAESNRSR